MKNLRIQTTKREIFEFSIRLRLSKASSLFSLIFVLCSCAPRLNIDDLTPLPESSYTGKAECRAKLQLKLETDSAALAFSAQSSFLLEGEDSSFVMYALTPIGTRIGKLSLSQTESLWTDSRGSRDINEEAIFAIWFQEFWWAELAALHSIATPHDSIQITTDPKHDVWAITSSERRIICRDKWRGFERSCEISSNSLRGRVNFTFLDCQ